MPIFKSDLSGADFLLKVIQKVKGKNSQSTFSLRPQEEKPGQDGLGEKDGGDAEVEFPLLRFVPEEIHPHERADAATGDGHPDERILRDAPLPPTGLPLVNPEDQEGQDIDADEVYEDCSQGCPGVRLLIGYYRFFTSFRMTNINQLAEKKKGRFKEATYKSRLYTSLCF